MKNPISPRPLDNLPYCNPQLLKKSVEQDGSDYHSLYELACDFWKADQRIEGLSAEVEERRKSKTYFDKAREYAIDANDQKYVSMIDAYLEDYKKWTEILRRNNIKIQ